MNSYARSDAVVQEAVKNLFLGTAPERQTELAEFWDTLGLKFCLLEDGDQITMEAGAYRYVHFNRRILVVIWVSAFAAWEAYSLATSLITEKGIKTSDRLHELLGIALEVRDTHDVDAVLLAGLPMPGELPDPKVAPEQRTAAELAMFATGWAMLHEVRHLKHQQEGTSATRDAPPELCREEELSCDQFATDFLMRDFADYADAMNADPKKVHMKRSLGIYFAMFAMVVLGYPDWRASPSHPSIQRRIDAVRWRLSGGQLDPALLIAHLAFGALNTLWPHAPHI